MRFNIYACKKTLEKLRIFYIFYFSLGGSGSIKIIGGRDGGRFLVLSVKCLNPSPVPVYYYDPREAETVSIYKHIRRQ